MSQKLRRQRLHLSLEEGGGFGYSKYHDPVWECQEGKDEVFSRPVSFGAILPGCIVLWKIRYKNGGSSAVHRYNGLWVLFLYTEIQTGDTSGIWIVGILESGFYLVLSCLYIL